MRISDFSLKKGISLTAYFACILSFIGLFLFGLTTAESMDEAVLTITGDSQAEDSGDLVFTISRSTISDTVTVTVGITDGTALSGSDFTAFPTQEITFAANGPDSITVTVPMIIDVDVEADETFQVLLSNPISATIGQASATGTIENDDSATVLFDFPTNITETEGSDLIFPVTVNNVISGGFSLSYTVSSGTASASDYSISTGSLSFSGGAGEEQSIIISAEDDNIVENTESFTVQLGAASDSPFAGDIVTNPANNNDARDGIITDNDSAEVSLTAESISENDGSIPITLTLSAPASENVSVAVSTSDGTATAGSDYTALNNSNIVILAGETTGTGSVSVSNDSMVEADETLSVTISSISAGGLDITMGSPDSASVTIDNDDSAVVTLTAPNDQMEGNSGTSTMVFTVQLDNPVDGGFSIPFNTNNGSALNGSDYVGQSGTLNFNGTANEQISIPITINGDSEIEIDDTFSVSLGNISGTPLDGSISRSGSPATATILNDDSIELSIELGSAPESVGNLPFTITLTTVQADPVTVTIRTNDGSASPGDNDFTRINNEKLVIPAGELSITSFVDIEDDSKIERDETLSVSILSFTTGDEEVTDSIPPASTGVIFNDDSAAVSIIEPISILEGDTGNLTLVISATVDNPVTDGFDVSYSVDAGTATSGVDYTGSGGTLSFSGSGGEVETFTLEIIGDEAVESNETILIQLGNVSGSIFASDINPNSDQVVATIIDNDTAGVTISDETVAEGTDGTTTITFDVTLTKDVTGGFMVDYATADDSALADGDYTSKSGTLNFTGNALETQSIEISVETDNILEPDEQFFVNLSNVSDSDVIILDGQGIGTVQNDDTASLSILPALTVIEGQRGDANALITVTLASGVQDGLSLAWSVVENGATVADNDYSLTNTPLAFAGTAGETQTIEVDIVGDSVVELDEALDIFLGALTLPAGISDGDVSFTIDQSVLTIENDDSAVIELESISRPEGTGDSPTQFEIAATLNASVDVPVRLTYETKPGTGVDGVDYIGITGTLEFTGTINEAQTIIVEVPADAEVEDAKTFSIEVTSIEALGRNITATTSTVTILDDDSAVTVFRTFLPVTSNDYKPVPAPDLVVTSVIVNASSLEITIKNIGTAAVDKAFWVDSYINPITPPTRVNQTIVDLKSEGFVWGIDVLASETTSQQGLPMEPGDEIILSVDGDFYRAGDSNFSGTIPVGSTIYVQVDSYGNSTDFGQIEESHEIGGLSYNNIFSVVGP